MPFTIALSTLTQTTAKTYRTKLRRPGCTHSSTAFYFLSHCCLFQFVKHSSYQLLARLNVFQYAHTAVKLHRSPLTHLRQIVGPFGKHITLNDIFLYYLCVTMPIIEEAIFLGTLKWYQMLDGLIVFKTRPHVLVLHTKSSRKQPPNHLRTVKYVAMYIHVWGCEYMWMCACVCKHEKYIYS